jgi:hypothetical protein
MPVTSEDLVRREVYYCVSYLVSTLAKGYGNTSRDRCDENLADLTEQAFELVTPIEDWGSAAIEAGAVQDSASQNWSDKEGVGYADARDFCDANDIEPHYAEIYEHWIVSDWLADKLAEHGEKVDKDFAGMIVWARTTTGQGIAGDAVIRKITDALNS